MFRSVNTSVRNTATGRRHPKSSYWRENTKAVFRRGERSMTVWFQWTKGLTFLDWGLGVAFRLSIGLAARETDTVHGRRYGRIRALDALPENLVQLRHRGFVNIAEIHLHGAARAICAHGVF